MTSGPNVHGSMERYLQDQDIRVTLLERRLAVAGKGSTGGGGTDVPPATETVAGKAEIATTAEVTGGTDDARFVTPLKLAQRIAAIPPGSISQATETVLGGAEIATPTEATTGTDHSRIITPKTLKTGLDTKAALTHTHTKSQITDFTHTHPSSDISDFATAVPAAVPPASETVQGKVELATAAETTTGTDSTRAVHPAGLKVELDKKAALAHTHPQSDITNLVSDLALKAPLASPALTGTPTAPTASAGTSTTQVATTAFVGAAVTAAAVPVASETVQGKVELATAAETTTGTDNTRAVHPAGLKVELDKKAALAHTHTKSQITDFAHTHVKSEITDFAHTHPQSEVTNLVSDLALKAPLASPVFTGNPTAPTPMAGDNDTSLATTAFVQGAIAAIPPAPTTPDATTTSKGIVQLAGDLGGTAAAPTVPGLAGKAPLASPAFTGNPTAPTPAPGDADTSIATTAFVAAAVSGGASVPDATETVAGKAEIATSGETNGGIDDSRIVTPLKLWQVLNVGGFKPPPATETAMGGAEIATAAEAATGTDHTRIITPLTLKTGLDLKANLASPAFTGNPTAPTPAPGDADTSLATTGFVTAAIAAITPGSVPDATTTSKGVVQLAGDLAGTAVAPTVPGLATKAPLSHTHTKSQITDFAHTHPQSEVTNLVSDLALKAPLASPAFTGNPTAPTPTAGDADTSVATTAFVSAAIAAIPPGSTPDATTTSKGVVQLAGDLAGTAAAPTVPGLAGKAALSHTHTSSQITDFATAVPAAVPVASETVQGKVELATTAEATTGTDTTRAVTPAGVKAVGDTKAPLSHTHTKSQITDFAHTHPQSEVTNLVSDLALKAPLASPAFTGNPTAPTPAPGDADTSIATTAFVAAALSGGSVPDASETVAGKAEIATSGETSGGIDDARIVTPLKLWQVLNAGGYRPIQPAGIIHMFASAGAPPPGYLICTGQTVSRTTYALLFNAIGTAYGVGDGSTTFNVPNFRGRVPVGFDSGQTEFDLLGEAGGAKTHTHSLSASAWALIRLAATATRQIVMRRVTGVPSWTTTTALTPSGTAAVAESTGETAATELGGATDAGSTLQPYLVVNYIISTGL